MRVLVCDDHALLAAMLAAHLEELGHEVVVAASPHEALQRLHLQAAAGTPVEVCLLDLVFPGSGTDGAQSVGPVLEVSPATRVLVLTGYPGSELARKALTAGAHGVVDKGHPLTAVAAAVERLGRTEQPAAEREGPRTAVPVQPVLTGREREVLALLVRGCTTGEISDRLGISVNTVRKHVQNVLEKFGTSSRLELVAMAARRGPVAARSWQPVR